ncbi:MAG TPA: hypothetical protein VGN20_18850 [Mucilaginibacter sp.]|jgi:hypothetical protein
MTNFIILTLLTLAGLNISAYAILKRFKTPIVKYLFTSANLFFLQLLIVMLFVFSNVNAAAVRGDQPIIILNGPWKFKTGDNLRWANPNFNDSEWETVDLTAPEGAHDGDVGLTGYVTGWTAKGHPNYSSYAWYRLKISLDGMEGNVLAIAGPPAVDDAYQVFINGSLLGNAGDFSGPVPVAYSIQPRMFLLPDSMRKGKEITIAFRVWADAATISQGSDLGGIHIAPELGRKNEIEKKYNYRWGQTIKGYIVEVALFATFIALAITILILRGPVNPYKWFIIALILLGMVRLNQAFYYWLQIETAHEIDIVTLVILMPLVLGSWLMAWCGWFKLDRPVWIRPTIIALTLIYMCAQLLKLQWLFYAIPHSAFQEISDYTRLLIALLLVWIIYLSIKKHGKEGWLFLPAVLLISTGLFAQEISALHIQGIWFPYGVGVSRTQYAYAAFSIVMFILLICLKQNEKKGIKQL